MTTELAIANAPHWLNHSTVVLKGLYLAEDEAWVANNMIKVQGTTFETHAGDQNVLKVKRMVKQGTVAVMLRDGTTYEVSLPKDTSKLLQTDLTYIASQIDALSQPMSAEEQADFLAQSSDATQAS